MLPQSERLSRSLVSDILKLGRRHSGVLFDTRYRAATSFKATVIVSKKVAPLSVGRHRLKRRMMEALRTQKKGLGKIHMACVLKKTAHQPSTEEYAGALAEFIRKELSKSV